MVPSFRGDDAWIPVFTGVPWFGSFAGASNYRNMSAGVSDTIQRLCEIPGPSGFEGRVRDAIIEMTKPYADRLVIDRVGNLRGAFLAGPPLRWRMSGMRKMAFYCCSEPWRF